MKAFCVALVLAWSVSAGAQPAAPVQGAKLEVPGGSIVYDAAGSGPPVVFLHGAFMDRLTWNRQFKFFAQQFRVIRYDLRPFGESTRPAEAYVVPDDLLRLLDHLKIDRAHLVGHSFGGAAALDFSLLHPERVASPTLASAPPNGFAGPADEAKASAAVFAAIKDGDAAIIKAWMAHPIWNVSRTQPEVAKEIEAITRRNLAPFRMTFAPYVPVKPAAAGRLAEVKAPTLVIVGDSDSNGIRQGSELEAKQIPGAKLEIVKGADHGLPVGWADEFNAAVLAFLTARR
jgi:pimeloyl-ACP methyl ester carboxylesterase